MCKLQQGQYLGSNRQSFHVAGLTLTDTVYHQKVFNGWHSHECAHITYVLDGGNLEKRHNNDEQLTPGKLVFYHSNESHRNDYTIFPSRNLNLEISPTFLGLYNLKEQQIHEAVRSGRFNSASFLRLFFDAYPGNYNQRDTSHTLLLESVTTDQCSGVPDWIARIRSYLNDSVNEDITLIRLAKEVNVHPVTISKYFRRYFGSTLPAYIRQRKIEKALTMIRSDRHTMCSVSYHCGFADQSHFIRTFRQNIGVRPKDFKKF